MTQATRDKISEVKAYLHESGLAEEHQDGLRSMLDFAADVSNGHPDKLQGMTDLLFMLVLHEVRKEIRQPKKIAEAVTKNMADHIGKCPMRSGAGLPKPLAMLYPFRNQICLAAGILGFAPQAPAIFEQVFKFFLR